MAWTALAIRAIVLNAAYLLWQQLSVQPSWQQVCPHLSLQQALQYAAFEKVEVCAKAVTPRTTASVINANAFFISNLL